MVGRDSLLSRRITCRGQYHNFVVRKDVGGVVLYRSLGVQFSCHDQVTPPAQGPGLSRRATFCESDTTEDGGKSCDGSAEQLPSTVNFVTKLQLVNIRFGWT